MRKAIALTLMPLVVALAAPNVRAGEMGAGVPSVGLYTQAAGSKTLIFLKDLVTPLAAGCSYLILSAGTVGDRDYKIAHALLLSASLTNRRVRFYAHGTWDGGCGVDYVQILD